METYEDRLKKCVNGVIDDFITDVSKKFKISEDNLKSLWNCREKSIDKTITKSNETEKYKDMKKPQLVKICKEMNLNTTGKKDDLINRIVNKKNRKETIVEKLDLSMNSIIIKKNKFGNYVHLPSKFVFSKENKCVIGKEDSNGAVLQLDKEDINICNKYKFKYNLPDDLNTAKGDDGDEIDDIIDDEEEDEEEDEDEEDD